MKSGLEGRNNMSCFIFPPCVLQCLNEVRPGRPEQSIAVLFQYHLQRAVSMKSGLEGRNNAATAVMTWQAISPSQ